MPAQHDVAIVVVSYNVRDLLRACLASIVRSLTRIPDLSAEVWVVDNGSSDGSAAMIEHDFPAVRLVRADHNPGFGGGNNIAIERSSSRHILLLNPDTEVRDDAIGHLVRFLDAHPDVGAAGCRLVYPDGSFQHASFEFPTLWQVLFDLAPLHHRLLEGRLNGRYRRSDYDRVMEVGHPLGACLIVRRRALDRVGALDEGYFMYCEEVDLCWRLRRAGWRILHTPGATVVHHGGQSTSQLRARMLVELHRSRLRFFERSYGRHFAWAARRLLRWHAGRLARNARRAMVSGALSTQEVHERLTASEALARL